MAGPEAGCEQGAAVQGGVISEEVRSLIAWPSLGPGWETGQTSGDECTEIRRDRHIESDLQIFCSQKDS